MTTALEPRTIDYLKALRSTLGYGYVFDEETSLIVYTAAGFFSAEENKLLLAFRISRFDDEMICTPIMVVEHDKTYVPYQTELLPQANEEVALWILVNRRGFLFDYRRLGTAVSGINRMVLNFCLTVRKSKKRRAVENKIIDFLCSLNVIDCDQAMLPFKRGDGATVTSTRTYIEELAQEFEDSRKIW